VRSTSLAEWLGFSLKRVRMDAEALYVSNYLREIRIPLSDVQHVSEILGRRHWNRVTITLRCDTPFGRKIDFLPASSRAGRRDAVVGELNALIRQ